MVNDWFFDEELMRLRREWVSAASARDAALAEVRTAQRIPAQARAERWSHEVAAAYFERAEYLQRA